MTDRDRDYAIRTLLAEAEGEGPEGMAAVANVIRNRMASGKYGGTTAGDVVTAENQFEPWNHAGTGKNNDPLRYSPSEERYQRAARIWDAVQSGQYDDPTGGATHFFAPKMQADMGRAVPSWAKSFKQTASLGGHTFYADPNAGVDKGEAIGAIQRHTRGKPMLDDQTGGMGSPQGADRPMTISDFQAAIGGLRQPSYRPNLLGQLLFGQKGMQGFLQDKLPNGLIGGAAGGLASLFGGGAQPGAAAPASPQPGAPMNLPGATLGQPPAAGGNLMASAFPGYNPLAGIAKAFASGTFGKPQGGAPTPAPAPQMAAAPPPPQPQQPDANLTSMLFGGGTGGGFA